MKKPPRAILPTLRQIFIQMIRILQSMVWVFLLAISLAFSASAGTITGKVSDALSGEALIGATVNLQPGNQSVSVKLDGSYIFKNIAPGNYQITVTFIGFKRIENQRVIVGSSGNVVVNLKLQPVSTVLQNVIVNGGSNNGASETGALHLEKKADIVENILSARTIQLLPDVTVANALQRMSGITLERNSSGQGRYAIIRGMQQRYNTTLINGIKIPSPDDKYRFVPLDIFPSDMVDRIEVQKSLTPAMEGDAIGGTVNLVMKNAPDRLLATANASLGYNTLFSGRPYSQFSSGVISSKSPAELHGNDYVATQTDFPRANLNYTNKNQPINTTAGFTIGDRFLNGKLGIILSSSLQNFYLGSNSLYLIPNAQPNPGNAPIFGDIYIRKYSSQTSRFGLQNKIDYAFNAKNHISLFNLYVNQNDYQSRYSVDSVLAIQRTGPGSGNVSISNRSRWQEQQIYNGTLQGDHYLSNSLHLNWSGVYSIATNKVPDMAEYTVDHSVSTDPQTGVATSSPSTTQTMSRIWEHNSDKDLAGYLNLKYKTLINNRLFELTGGGLYRHKQRDNYYNAYSLDPTLVNGAPQTFTTFNNAQYFFKNSGGVGTFTAISPNSYTAHEDISAGYLQASYLILPKLQLLTGLRVENTRQDYTTVMPLSFSQRSGTISYTDLLPSAHLKYSISETQNLRLSYFSSISRPAFYELTPYQIPGEYFDEIGNPNLKHTRADNFDFRYELFPGLTDEFLVGGFYKNIKNPIEYFVVRNGGPSAQFIRPGNSPLATNYGLEAVITHYVGSFGISANYTYTKSEVTTDKLSYTQTLNGPATSVVRQNRPLQGQAENIGNISLLYKNPRIGLDIQLAYVYTGERISQVSPYVNLDYWQKAIGQLDFSFEQRIFKKFSIYAKVNNLTNAANTLFLKASNTFRSGQSLLPNQTSANRINVQQDIYKVSFLGGLRYKL